LTKERYTKMIYRRCGKSGLKLPVVSLGLWHNFGDVDDFIIARDMILHAFNLGITHFDLANNYGPSSGSAEINFGQIIKNNLTSHRDEMIISTKAGYYMWEGPYGDWGSKKYLVSSLDQSLKRMQLEYVDIFYHHRPDPETPLEETMAALDLIVKQGKALYIGLSNYDHIQTQIAVEILERLGTHCLIHQPKYNMFNRWVEQDLLGTLNKLGIGCISFSPLAQGVLSDKYLNGIPANSRAAKEYGFLNPQDITEENIKKLLKLKNIADERGHSLAQLALVWNLRHQAMTSVLIGTSSVEQIKENVHIIENLDISEYEISKIEEILN